MKYQFEEKEMPYSTLGQFGLTPEMVEDLPVDILEEIYEGRPSPVLPVKVTLNNCEEVTARTRFS